VIDALRDEPGIGRRRPSASTFTPGAVLPTDYETFLLSIDAYDKVDDAAFADFIGKLEIVIEYASLYGDKKVVRWSRAGDGAA